MQTRIVMLYLIDGISPLDSRKSLSVIAKARPGSVAVQSIRRVPGGYMVGYRNKLYVVHDARVEAAEIEEFDPLAPADPAVDVQQQTQEGQAALADPTPATPAGATEPPEPGAIVKLPNGMFTRVPKAPPVDPPPPDPRHEEAKNYVPRQRRKRTEPEA